MTNWVMAALVSCGHGRWRPPGLRIKTIPVDSAGVNLRENAMLHVLDLGANYWSLWTEAENLEQYNARFPEGFELCSKEWDIAFDQPGFGNESAGAQKS